MKRFILNIPNHSQGVLQLLSATQFCFAICKSFPGLQLCCLKCWLFHGSPNDQAPWSRANSKMHYDKECLGRRPSQKWPFLQLLIKHTLIKSLPPCCVLWPSLWYAMWWDRRSMHKKGRHLTTKLSRQSPKSISLLLPAGFLLIQEREEDYIVTRSHLLSWLICENHTALLQ